MKSRAVMTIGILLLGVMVLFAGCAKEAPAPAPAPAPVPTPAPAPAPAPAPESAADFFKKNPVTLIVNSSAGGGTDYGARLVAAYWNQYTGGHMAVINEPGGGGMVAVNRIYSAKPDGLTVGTAVLGAFMTSPILLGKEGIQYDPLKFNYLTHFANEPYSFAVGAKQSFNSMKDVQAASNVIFGAADPMSTAAGGAAVISEIYGLKAKVVSGFKGADLGVAASKGEINGYTYHGSGLSSEIGKGFVKKPFVHLGKVRDDWFPDVPTVAESMTLTAEQQALLDTFNGMLGGKVFFTSPGIPQDRVAFMQDAFNKIVADKAFLQQAKLQWAVWSKPDTGAETAKFVSSVLSAPKANVEMYKQVLAKYAK